VARCSRATRQATRPDPGRLTSRRAISQGSGPGGSVRSPP
jgi:hypothetical protein